MHGTDTSTPEVTHISQHGIWLLIGQEERLLTYEHFPWFRSATVEQIHDVRRESADHLHWPQLDVDLSLESIRRPEDFPLVAKDQA